MEGRTEDRSTQGVVVMRTKFGAVAGAELWIQPACAIRRNGVAAPTRRLLQTLYASENSLASRKLSRQSPESGRSRTGPAAV